MSCSGKSLRSKLDRFLATPYYIIAVMALSIVAHLFSLEVPVYTAFVLVAIYTALFGKDLLPLTPLFLFFYISPSIRNNPGYNEQSVFSGATGTYLLVVCTGMMLAFGWHVVRNRQTFFKTKRKLLPGFLVLSAAYMLSGVGSENYINVWSRNLLFAGMQVAALMLPYLLLSSGVDWENARKDYFAWVGIAGSVAVLVQLIGCYATENIVVDGVIDRNAIYTGWGMYNNMGMMIALGIPCAFYLADKYRCRWVGVIAGAVLVAGLLATCSRTSSIIGIVIYCVCMGLVLRHARKRIHIIIALASVVAIGGLVILLFRERLLYLFSGLLKMILHPSHRDLFFRKGMEIFDQAPVLGSSFYSPGYLPWDFSIVESFSALIPPRWHNTYLQLLVSCGVVGLGAYGYHRYETVRMFLQTRSKEKTFIACALCVILGCSLYDCHFFNLGPALIYSAGLAFAEYLKQ